MSRDRSAASWFKSFGFLTLMILGLVAVTGRSFAQVDEGSITGLVQDPSGAVVPGAQVTLLNTDQGITLSTTTNSGGEYTFSPVRIGHYTVSVTAAGFSKTEQQNLSVNADSHLQVNVALKTGATTETVQVTTAPPQLQTEEASVGQTVTGQSVNNLPLNGRNFTFLAQLGAGVNTPQADTRGNAASGAFTANGLRPSQNNYLLDGIDNNSNAVDFLNGTNFVVLPPVDAIAEFKVQTADFSAQLGRAAGAVMNATIKSGTNSFHGAAWEFLRNDKLDAADWFENFQGIKKGKLVQNQFGATIGGPVIKNKIFFFGDYEGLRRVAGNTQSGIGVPTLAERNSGYTNLQDVQTGQASASPSTRKDALGRIVPVGTILDPATTRAVTKNQLDNRSGLVSNSSGYVRDPFTTACGPGSPDFSIASCPDINILPAGRLDPNSIKLLNLYPEPTNGSFTSNFASNPNLFEHRNAFDTREDFDITQKDQVFFRFSYVDDPQMIPGPFGGVADGGGFQQGLQTAKSDQSALAYTHVFNPSLVNVARGGFNHLHTTRFGPEGTTAGIPEQFGIAGIPQQSENGGLPSMAISGLNTLGSNAFLPSDEVSDTLQITDDFTKIYGTHSFKMGIEFQNVKFSTLQPAYSRGDFEFNSDEFTDVVNVGGGNTGRAQYLLDPIPSTVGGVDYVGGPSQVQASNISKTYDAKKYFAAYFQDDWKVTPRLTLNLGIRYDYFGPINETNGGQANFVPNGAPDGKPEYLIPASGKDVRDLSPSFLSLLQKDGIALVSTNKYGQGLVQTVKSNFAPRVGVAYELDAKTVLRGGFGMFYNSFENQGYGPNIGENYPFVYNFNFQQQNLGIPYVTPIGAGSPWAGCASASAGGTATLNSGLSCVQFTPLKVNASGLNLQGLQFAYDTPLTLSVNATVQRAITRTMSAVVSYVGTEGQHLQTGTGTNNVTAILPAGAKTSDFVPFPDFGHGSSYHRTIGRSNYNGLQTTLSQQFSDGLQFLVAYTWSKTISDAGDLLNGGSTNGYRAPDVPGLGPSFDRGLADFDIRNVFHTSGYYELPIGKDKKFLANAGTLTNAVVGGWAANVIASLQGGQPISLSCPTSTTAGTNCTDLNVPGQSQKLGLHKDSKGHLNWFGNPAAFNQPCVLGANGQPDTTSVQGCVPLTGAGLLGGYPTTTRGPGIARFDFSAFKNIPITERFSMQFRAEIFNILNHPTFNAPNFGGNGVSSISGSNNFTNAAFGEIGSTRFAPYDARQIQFALKLYY